MICLVGLFLPAGCLAGETKSGQEEILLDYVPMHDPLQRHIEINTKGDVLVYKFTGLRILSILSGVIPTSNISSLFSRTKTPEFQAALSTKSHTSRDLSQGDLFYLVLDFEQPKTASGFTQLAPAPIVSFIEELNSFNNDPSLQVIKVSSAYLKCELIEPNRFSSVKSNPYAKVLKFEKLSLTLQMVLKKSLENPRRFISLSEVQYQYLLANKFSPETFIEGVDNGYQVQLFTKASL